MARSMLVYQEVPETATGTAVLIGLHGRGGDLDQLVPLARHVGPCQLIAPQAARPVSPVTQGHTSADGFTWYFIQEIGYPEPATFGEGLWLVEQFVYDVRDRQGAGHPLFLVGYEQGAVLAVTLAAVVPEILAGVAAICGYWPDIQGWSPPVDKIDRLPVLLVHDPDDREITQPLIDKTATELSSRGATVELQRVDGARQNPLAAAGVLRKWIDAINPTRQRDGLE
jgi:predicted esterase